MKQPSPPIQVSPALTPEPAVAQQGAMTAAVPAIKALSKQPPLAPPQEPHLHLLMLLRLTTGLQHKCKLFFQQKVRMYLMHELARLY